MSADVAADGCSVELTVELPGEVAPLFGTPLRYGSVSTDHEERLAVHKWGQKVRLYEEDAHWWRCPNDPPCPHAGVFHDIEEPGDPIPTCCFAGCPCGHVTAEVRAAAWAALTDESARVEMTGPQPCPDCGAPAGEEHDDGCDVARCLQTGLQRLSCAVWYETHNCGRDVWTGVWPARPRRSVTGWT